MEGSGDGGGEVGLQSTGLIPGEQGQTGHPVLCAPAEQLLEQDLVLRGKAEHQGPTGQIGYVQLGAQLPGQGGAPDVEAGHQGAGHGVIPGVDDGGIGLGGTVGHIVFPLHDPHFELIFGQLKGSGRAHDAAADDENVIHSKTSRKPLLKQKKEQNRTTPAWGWCCFALNLRKHCDALVPSLHTPDGGIGGGHRHRSGPQGPGHVLLVGN